METIVKNNGMSTEEVIQAKENQINNFANRLTTGEYKTILYNNQTPILADNVESFIDCIVYDLDDDSVIELKGDVLVIHTKNEVIELKGRKRMSDGEIYLRNFLTENSATGSLIIRDRLNQIEIEESNIFDIKHLFARCKNIVNIRTVAEDSEHYLMNWDCLLVKFKNQDKEEIWQPA